METGVFICLIGMLMSGIFLITAISSHIDRSNANTKVAAKVTGYAFTGYGEDAKMYVPTVEYEYGNEKYSVMLDVVSCERESAEERYPLGTELTAFIRSDKPRFATVNENRGGDRFGIVCSAVFFCLMLAAFVSAV